jgi:hypothetical protein
MKQSEGFMASESDQQAGCIAVVDLTFLVAPVESKPLIELKRVERVFLPLCLPLNGFRREIIVSKPPVVLPEALIQFNS